MKPFLNWAGGKRWLTVKYPEYFFCSYERYIEPFLGSGAIFFAHQPKNAILSDSNQQLIDTYKAVRDDYDKVLNILKIHDSNHCTEYYYNTRNRQCTKSHTKAAQFIYLNRTCFNGLYRVNKEGVFNVPIGTKKNVLREDDDFSAWASILKNAIFYAQDFEKTIQMAHRGDFVYVDPPYTVRHNQNGFLKYNEKIFSWNDQERLSRSLNDASDRGAKILISNADHDSIHSLYSMERWTIDRVTRFSGIAAASGNRKGITEILIRNYDLEKSNPFF
ncbi:DNA methyltransferase [Gordonibacter sp. 28C]|uniref:DNA adenine methylase n=1 Tax=Gordonibacter sp. 28C TaxID=2078569 RepID=UPI000DF866B1|nr:Dam family site-specific DNA-(adenine-N6)-methyltransferase [Gordonibacter sp. 28C]RDB60511.1 DNA methyltransferase [Gordonibacter sp. 28C]